jgi:hypothetical protein
MSNLNAWNYDIRNPHGKDIPAHIKLPMNWFDLKNEPLHLLRVRKLADNQYMALAKHFGSRRRVRLMLDNSDIAKLEEAQEISVGDKWINPNPTRFDIEVKSFVTTHGIIRKGVSWGGYVRGLAWVEGVVPFFYVTETIIATPAPEPKPKYVIADFWRKGQAA